MSPNAAAPKTERREPVEAAPEAPPIKVSTTEFPPLAHKEILSILVGLLLALFVTNLSGTIVTNALPTIIRDLQGTQQQYTWIVTAALLASTASVPVWGKLADLFDKKKLLMSGLGIFIVGSLLSGFATSIAMLIAFRVIQGLGFGAMMSLVQTIIATIIPPRQRGRYAAYTGATIAAATVIGPLLGGYIVDQSWLGWRWCFWSAVILAAVAIVVLFFRLRVPRSDRGTAKVDWVGATLVSAGVSVLLIWISFAGNEFDWWSWQTAVLLPITVVILAVFVVVEFRVKDPIIDFHALGERTTLLAVLASIAVGIGMFGASVFLGQYFQISRGFSPTEAGLLSIPMMFGVLLSSLFIGRWVSRIGKWKPFVVVGAFMLAIGFAAAGFIGYSTSIWVTSAIMVVVGLGVGMTMQNLVLAVQNTVSVKNVGAATSTITFFRSLGGVIGVQVLGTIYAHRVSSLTTARLNDAGLHMGASTGETSLDLSSLPDGVAEIIRSAYGDGIGLIFLVAAGVALIGAIATCFMKATMLRETIDLEPVPDAEPVPDVRLLIDAKPVSDAKTLPDVLPVPELLPSDHAVSGSIADDGTMLDDRQREATQ